MDLREKREQFAADYGELFAYVYRFMCYRIPHKQDAEDAAADVLAGAYAKIGRFDPERGSLRQWLTGHARNTVLMYWRGRRPTVSLDEVVGTVPERSERDCPHDTDVRMTAARIVAALPAETKAVLALRFVDGLTHEEIASLLGKEPAAIRQFFSRLQRRLRLRFSDNEA
jgi:RNA polymerase sigma-70 factor (ECF subfamily)